VWQRPVWPAKYYTGPTIDVGQVLVQTKNIPRRKVINTQDAGVVYDDFSRPLVVSPRQACQLLSVGLTRLYELLKAGELDSFLVGRSRRVTLASIHAYIELHRAAACREPTPMDSPRASSEKPRSSVTSFESTFADTAASIGKVIETMTDSVMGVIAGEMSNLGCKDHSGDNRALREAVYAVVTRNVIDAAVRKMNEGVSKNPFYRSV
jgi:excisionase family DNA binding protein